MCTTSLVAPLLRRKPMSGSHPVHACPCVAVPPADSSMPSIARNTIREVSSNFRAFSFFENRCGCAALAGSRH